jgi:alpha-glucosidase
LASCSDPPAALEAAAPGAAGRVEVLADGVVRVRRSLDGTWRLPAEWDVVPDGLSITARSVRPGRRDQLASGGLVVGVDGSTAGVSVTAGGAEILAAEAVGWSEGCSWVRLRRGVGERHFGCGERATGLDQTMQRRTFWNRNAREHGPDSDNLYSSIPFVLAVGPLGAFGVLVDTAGWAAIEPDAETWTVTVTGAHLDLVVVDGPTPADVLARFTGVVGRTPLPPRWALGYHQSRWGYDSAAELRRIAGEFEARQLPCDALHLDIGHMDRHRVFTWHPERFPDPAGLVAELSERGHQIVAIVDPGVAVDEHDATFRAGVELDAFIRDGDHEPATGFVWPGRCAWPDFLRPEVRRWWSDLHRTLTDVGVAGIWNDMNEPAIYADPVGSTMSPRVIELPDDAEQGPLGNRVAHHQVHNLYGASMAGVAFDALAELRPSERSFVLTRSAFTGIQRHAAVWTGDNTSSWEHLRLSLPMLCNLGLSGVPFVGADIGGFWGDCPPELFARWIQAGVLYPFMRSHSHRDNHPNEPWSFGPEVEAAARAALLLRHQLVPYLTSLFDEAARTGAPLLRPVWWEFPDHDPGDDHVMLGACLLAAPVLDDGHRRRQVHLPAGAWYDWWTGERHDGGRTITVAAPLDRLPLFGRAGHVVPTRHPSDAATVVLRTFPGSGNGTWYDDDGCSRAHEHGVFARRTWRVTDVGGATVVQLGPVEGSYRPPRRLRVEVAGGSTGEIDDLGDAATVAVADTGERP